MSPRSEEFMHEARDRLRGAELALHGGVTGATISLAYYATLYAARAALSEEDEYAKTHSGTWNLFHLTFVASRRFDAALAQEARDRQALREAADHDAHQVSVDEARHALDEARAFVDGVERMLEA